MLAVRHYPELVTPALLSWLRGFVKYDDDGRGSCWLATAGGNGGLPIILAAVAEAVMPGVRFTGVLLQSYRDGSAVTPCHTDDGGTGDGFILSLGSPRTFRVHRIADGCETGDAVHIQCVEGTALLMDCAFHAGWHHQIIADPTVTGEKLSLVFRTDPGGA